MPNTWNMYTYAQSDALRHFPPDCKIICSHRAPATSAPHNFPSQMSTEYLPDLGYDFLDGMRTDTNTFQPGSYSTAGTPAIQIPHFQFNSHQINLSFDLQE